MRLEKEQLAQLLDITPPMLWISSLYVEDACTKFSGTAEFFEDFFGFNHHAPVKNMIGKKKDGTALGALPGTFCLESMAQSSAAAIAIASGTESLPIIGKCSTIFVRPITPGAIAIQGEMSFSGKGWAGVNVIASQDGLKCVSASIGYSIRLPNEK